MERVNSVMQRCRMVRVCSCLALQTLLRLQGGEFALVLAAPEYEDGKYVGQDAREPAGVQFVVTSFPVPTGYATGLAWDGASLWLCDGVSAGVIYRLSPADGTVLDSYDIGVYKLRGMTMGDGFLWVASWETEAIYKLVPATGQIVHSFPAPFAGKPDGLAWLAGTLWVGEETDTEVGLIHRVDATSGLLITSMAAPPGCCFNPRGLAWDGLNLWAGYQSVGLIYKLHPGNGTVRDSFAAPSGGFQQGLTFDGQYLWSTGGDNWVYKIDVGAPVSVEPAAWAKVKALYRP